MAQTIYCRHDDCGEAYLSEAGKKPTLCPACQRVASWTTWPPIRITPNYADPVKPYALSENDRGFLKSLRIGAE